MLAGIGAGIMIVVMAIVLPLVVSSLAYPYMSLRLRDSREEHRDPELGIKAAYYLVLSGAILLILLGLTISAIDVMDGAFEARAQQRPQPKGQAPRDPFDQFADATQRTAWGVTISGLLFSLTAMLLLKMGTNDSEFPAAKRVFAGGRLAFIAVIVMITITVLIVLFFQKEVPRKEPYEILTAILMVWLPALAIHVFLMRLYAGQPYYVEKHTYSSRRGNRDDFGDDD